MTRLKQLKEALKANEKKYLKIKPSEDIFFGIAEDMNPTIKRLLYNDLSKQVFEAETLRIEIKNVKAVLNKEKARLEANALIIDVVDDPTPSHGNRYLNRKING